jgi:drug/metabolite transporter (DMT)-like permease
MGYLSVAHTGAGFISLTFAFPVLMTWLIARLLRMDGARPGQGAGVAAALLGGVLLASGKLDETGGPGGGAFWVLVASGIPVALALGNIFRSRYWPAGERPLPLAALSVLCGAALVLPAAVFSEGARLPLLWSDPGIVVLVLAGAVVVAAQFALQFRLQELAGPVYMSQIGGVAAMAGAILAVVAQGEGLPPAFWPAAALIAVGTVVFQRAARAG